MRQRVMIAMAMACSPRLLIADEPTTALDVTIQAQVMDLIDGLRKSHSLGVLLITHDLGVVAQWADRVAVMYAGNLIESAPVGSFYRNPQHPYSRGLLESSIDSVPSRHYLADRLREIPGNVSSAAHMTGCPFLPRCNRVVEACSIENPPLRDMGAGRLTACDRGATVGQTS
jgi:peptide/nickel transport system ATP-binding protein